MSNTTRNREPPATEGRTSRSNRSNREKENIHRDNNTALKLAPLTTGRRLADSASGILAPSTRANTRITQKGFVQSSTTAVPPVLERRPQSKSAPSSPGTRIDGALGSSRTTTGGQAPTMAGGKNTRRVPSTVAASRMTGSSGAELKKGGKENHPSRVNGVVKGKKEPGMGGGNDLKKSGSKSGSNVALQTPRRALSTVTQQQIPGTSTMTATQRRTRPGPKRTQTNPLLVHPSGVEETVALTAKKSPSTRLHKISTHTLEQVTIAESSRVTSTSDTKPASRVSTPAAHIRSRSPHTPEDQIGINPLKRRVPTTFDRPTGGRKFQRIGEPEEEVPVGKAIVLSDDIEECDPMLEEPAFSPPTPPESRLSTVLESTMARKSKPTPPTSSLPAVPILSLPDLDHPLAGELALEMPALLDPEQLELDLGELELPDIDFVV